MKEHTRFEPIEKFYFSHDFKPISVYCSSADVHVSDDPASWQKMVSTSDDCERTATVALPTAASTGSISGDLGTTAALDALSTVY